MAATTGFAVLKDLPSDPEPSETSSYESEEDEWETDECEDQEGSDQEDSSQGSKQTRGCQQQHSTAAAPAEGPGLKTGVSGQRQPASQPTAYNKQVKSLRSTLPITNTSQAAPSCSSTGDWAGSNTSGLKQGFFGGSSSSSNSSSGNSAGNQGSAEPGNGNGRTGLKQGFFGGSNKQQATSSNGADNSSSTGGLKQGFFNKPPQQHQQQHQQQRPPAQQQPAPFAFGRNAFGVQQQNQKQPHQQQQQQARQNQQPQQLRQQQQQQQQPVRQPAQQQPRQHHHQQQSKEQQQQHKLFRSVYEICGQHCLRCTCDGPDAKYVRICNDLHTLLNKHPHLEQQLHSPQFKVWLLQHTDYRSGNDGVSVFNFWMHQLVWNVAISGSVTDLQRVLKLVTNTDLRTKARWFTLALNQHYRWSGDSCKEVLPLQLVAQPKKLYLWEELVKHNRWEVLLEGLKHWPDVFSGSLAYNIDTSDGILLLQHLLYVGAPIDIIRKVLERVKHCNEQLEISTHLWFFPPALMAAGLAGGPTRSELRKCRLPDALTLAVQQGRHELVDLLLEYVQWPVAALPEGRSYLTDGCEVAVDTASLSQPDRRGWWFDSAAVWTAVRRADELTFNKLLESINRSTQSPDADSEIPDLDTDGESDAESDEEYDRYRSYHHRPNKPNRNWQPAINYHIDAIIEGTTPLLLAVRAGNVRLAKSLLQAGADPLTVCAAGSSSKKNDSSSKGSSSSTCWTTPLLLAVEMNSVKLLQAMAPGLANRPEILRPKPFATPKTPVVQPNDDGPRPHTTRDVTVYNSVGDTPLTLAVRLRYYNAAVALLAAGFNPCQVVNVFMCDTKKDEHTHALMLAVKAASECDSSPGGPGAPVTFLQQLLKPTPKSPHGLIDWQQQLTSILHYNIAVEDRSLLTNWLSQQQQVVVGLTGDTAQYKQLLLKFLLQPTALQLLLEVCAKQQQDLAQQQQGEQLGNVESPLNDPDLVTELLLTALRCPCEHGSSLNVLLDKLPCAAGVLSGLADDAVAVHSSNAGAVAKHITTLLELGLPPHCKDCAGQTPLSHMLLPFGLECLQPLLDTNDQRVLADVDHNNWKHNLLHAAAAISDIHQRSAALAAVAGKAAQQGWHTVFTAKNTKQQTAAALAKNGRLKQFLGEVETRARQVAAANKQKAAKAAAAAAAAAGMTEQQQQKEAGRTDKDTGESGVSAAAAAVAAVDDGSKSEQTAAAAAQQQQEAAEKEAAVETEQQRRERLDCLFAMIPSALQAALTPAAPLSAAARLQQQEEQQQKLTSLKRAAQDVELVRSRIASLAPDHIPEKDVPLSEGVLPADAAVAAERDCKRQRRMAAAAAAAANGESLDVSDLDDSDDGGDDGADLELESDVLPCSGSAAAGVEEADDFDENSLNGLPWEFTMTREARLEWTNLELRLKRLVGVRLRRLGLGYWYRDGVSKRLNISEPGLELWRTKITRGARIIWQITVDYSKARGWVDMLRVWSIHATHAHYDRTLSGRTGTLHAIIASHRRSQKVRRKLHLKALAFTRADSSSGLRLPGSYEALPSAEDDDDLAAVALAGVGGGRDGTAEELARIRAAAQQPEGGRDAGEEQQQQGGGGGDARGQIVDHLPPANGAEDVYTLLKMYTVSSELVRAVLRGQGEEEVDFPFRVSKAEMTIIEMVPRPPSSILLLGRSGTGKTTVLVFRLFSAWLARYQHSHEHLQAVFVTASATLKEQVARTFRKLQAAAMTDADDAVAVAAATSNDPTTLVNLAPAAFPLFTTTRQWLMLLDASMARPFFVRGPDGRLAGGGGAADDSEIQDWDGIGLEVDLQGWTDDEGDDEYEDEEEDEEDEDAADWEAQADAAEAAELAAAQDEQQEGSTTAGAAGNQQQRVGRRRRRHGAGGDDDDDGDGEAEQQQQGTGKHWPSREVTYADFVCAGMWSAMTKGLSKEEKARLKAPLVYQEVMSYIKGSAEALEAGGRLSLEQYHDLGRKRAPNFNKELRPLVYRCYEAYEAAKAVRVPGRGPGWDRADLAAHLYRQLLDGQYRGVRLDGMFRDEVQDFLMAELLLDLKVCADPNSMFYCGDTCQTIARGVGFRFEEVRTLLYKENERRKGEGIPVGMPKLEVLKVNYRTHAGILDAASSITALLRACFPLLLDKLPRESAFFSGPRPLLLDGLSTEELSILLSSGDPTASQVEFGAHQVVLVRDMDARDRLPAELKASNALIMTVGQSKGLEFDDCFLVDFCADSPASQEWRVLLQLLEQYEETVAEVAKYVAAKSASSGKRVSWRELADKMSAQDIRLALKDAASSGDPTAGAALAAANRDGLLLSLPGAAQLTDVGDAAAAAMEAGGWLRPLKFDSAAHSLLCEELKHLYVAITRAKNNLVIFDRDSQKRAPLYRFFRRLGLATHVASVTGGLVEPGQGQAAGQTPEVGIMRGSMSNTPPEWAKRARNLVEMKLFKLAAQCYGCAGDVLRAAAYGAMQQLLDIHTNAQEASGAAANSSSTTAAGGRSKATSGKSADGLTGKAKRQAMLLAAADVLLTCAVQGGILANPRSAGAATAAVAAITAAAQRAGVPVPQQEIEDAVKPPLTPKEQLSWLRLAANAFKAAGRVLEAGKLLLGFGPDVEDGKYWQVAKKLLTSISNENAAVAAVFEDAARQELGLGRSSRGSDTGQTGSTAAAAAAGVHGSFLSASRLLREALSLYQQAGMWADCWRLLNEYEGLRPLLRQKAVDEITLAWIHSAKRPGMNRDEILKAINTLRDPAVREATLRMLGFWRELAAAARDPAEAARLLAQHGDYEAAADRCLAVGSFLDRATVGQLKQVHGWLLRAGTPAAARKAVAMWESLQQAGRLSDDIAEGLALAQLTLARLLLRDAVGAQLPAIELQKPAGEGSKSKKMTDAEKEAQKRAEKRERRKQDKERLLKDKKPQQKEQQQGATATAAADEAAADAGKQGDGPPAPVKSYAAAATAAAERGGVSSSASTAQKTSQSAVASSNATMPTACLSNLQGQVQAWPGYQAQVQEAVRALADAQQTFLNCHQPAGAVEALSWALAAKPAADITTAAWQMRGSGEGGVSDVESVLQQAKEATELLQALATISGCAQGARPRSGSSVAGAGGSLSSERVMVCLSALERFYGVKQLADNKQSMHPLEFRDESVMFIEALFALDSSPGQHLIPPAANSSHIRVPLIPYNVALRAIAAHIYKHIAASLARCIRAALNQLWKREWLAVKLTEAASLADAAAAAGGEQDSSDNNNSSSSGSSKGAQGRGRPRPSSGGGSGKGTGKAVKGLDLEQSQIVLQRSGEVLLLALSAHSTLRDAAAVLHSSHHLADLAVNEAFQAADSYATQLGSLAVALEFPAVDLGLDNDRGTAGAMTLMQAGLKKLPIKPKGGVSSWFDSCRQLPLQKLTASISQLSPYDTTTALWWLRASCHKFTTAAAADHARSKHEITEHIRKLRDKWYDLALKCINDSEAYQVLLEDRHFLSRAQFAIDAELLVRSREAWLVEQPAEGCAQLLLLLERSLIKEQLAAGQLQQQQQADVAGSSSSSSANWSKVRPLAPDLYMQLLESVAAAALMGLAISSGSSSTNPNSGYCYLPSTARHQLLDSVMLPAGSLAAVSRSWQTAASGKWGDRSHPARGGDAGARQKTQAEVLLQRCLRVCYHLATQNWRWNIQQQQQQQQEEEEEVGPEVPPPPPPPPTAVEAVAAEEAEPTQENAASIVVEQQQQQQEAKVTGPMPVVFAEHLAAFTAGNFDSKVLYNHQQQQHDSLQQSSGSGKLGEWSAAYLPILAARCSLLLGCLIMTVGAWDTASSAAGGGSQRGGRSSPPSSPLSSLLLPAVTAAQEMARLAADMAEAEQQQGSHGSSDSSKQQQQHWLLAAVQPLQQLLALLQPAVGNEQAAAAPTTRSKSKAANGANDRRVSVAKWSEALLTLAQALGVQLLQVGALVGSDKPYHGLSAKPAAQLPKQERALAQAVINCAVPTPAAAAAAAIPPQLQLPSLTEVHLGQRLSPAELKALEEKAKREEALKQQLQAGRLRLLRACPAIRSAVRSWQAEVKQRLADRAAQEQAARAAEAAAAAGAAAGAAGAGFNNPDEVWLPDEVYLAWNLTPQDPYAGLVKLYQSSTVIGHAGSSVLVSAHKVGQRLKDLEETETLTELLCPICAAASSKSQQQQQGIAAVAAGAEGRTAAAADLAGGSSSGGGVLSAAASTFVPHKFDGARHGSSMAAYQMYVHFVQTQVTPQLWAAAHLEYYILQYQKAAQDSHEMHLLMQRPIIRLSGLTECAYRLFESMDDVRECRDWSAAPHRLGVLLAGLRVAHTEAYKALAQFLQDLQRIAQERQQQQQQVYSHQQLEAQLLASAGNGQQQQQQLVTTSGPPIYQQQYQQYQQQQQWSALAAGGVQATANPWGILQEAGAAANDTVQALSTPATTAVGSIGATIWGAPVPAAAPVATPVANGVATSAVDYTNNAGPYLASAADDMPQYVGNINNNTSSGVAPTAAPAASAWGAGGSFASVVSSQLHHHQQQQQQQGSVRPPPLASGVPSPPSLPLYRPPGLQVPAALDASSSAASGGDGPLSSVSHQQSRPLLSPAHSPGPGLHTSQIHHPAHSPGPGKGSAAAAAGPVGFASDFISPDEMLSFVNSISAAGEGQGGDAAEDDGDAGGGDDDLELRDDDFIMVESKKKKKRSGQARPGRGGNAPGGGGGGGGRGAGGGFGGQRQQQYGRGGMGPARGGGGGAQQRGSARGRR